MDDFVARDFDKCDGLGVAGLEAHGGTCRDVEVIAISAGSVEFKGRVSLDEVVMRADLITARQLRQKEMNCVEYLYWSVTLAGDLEFDPLPTFA